MPVPKNVVPLHPQSREMPFRKGGILVQAESRKACFYAEAQPEILTNLKEKAEIAQLVEHNLAKVGVAGPSPVFRSFIESLFFLKNQTL